MQLGIMVEMIFKGTQHFASLQHLACDINMLKHDFIESKKYFLIFEQNFSQYKLITYKKQTKSKQNKIDAILGLQLTCLRSSEF